MNFVKYILLCLMEAITLGTGRPDLVTDDSKMIWIGMLCYAVLILVFSISNFLIFVNKKYRILYSILLTLAFIAIFAVVSILIEYLVTK